MFEAEEESASVFEILVCLPRQLASCPCSRRRESKQREARQIHGRCFGALIAGML